MNDDSVKIKYSEFKIGIINISIILGIILSDIFNVWIVLSVLIFIPFIFYRRFAIVGIITLFILAGGIRYYSYRLIPTDSINNLDSKIYAISGVVKGTPLIRKGKTDVFVDVKKAYTSIGSLPCNGIILASIKTDIGEIEHGANVYIESYFYESFSSTNPSKFDYSKYLARKNIYICTSVKEANQISITPNKKFLFGKPIFAVKDYIQKIFQEKLNKSVSEMTIGMVLGNSWYLSDNLYENVLKTGTLHLMAASGFNCYILAIMCQVLFFFIPYRYRGILTILIMFFYAFMIGMGASIVRATFMSSLVILGIITKRRTSYRHIMILSAVLILLINPSFAFDAGFQLSYLCMVGLLYFLPIIDIYNKKIIKKIKETSSYALSKIYGYVVSAYLATFACIIFTLPFSTYYFNYFSLISIIANVPIVILATFLFVTSILLIPFANVPVLGDLMVWFVNLLGDWNIKTINFFGNIKGSAINIGEQSIFFILCWYAILVLVIHILSKKAKAME